MHQLAKAQIDFKLLWHSMMNMNRKANKETGGNEKANLHFETQFLNFFKEVINDEGFCEIRVKIVHDQLGSSILREKNEMRSQPTIS